MKGTLYSVSKKMSYFSIERIAIAHEAVLELLSDKKLTLAEERLKGNLKAVGGMKESP